VAVFRDRLTGRELVAGTTHVLWNPKRGLVKLKQLQCLFSHMASLRQRQLQNEGGQPPPRAVLLLGDLNLTPGSALHAFLLQGVLQASAQTEGSWDGQRGDHDWQRGVSAAPFVHEQHSFGPQLVSAYGWVGEPECTSFHGGFKGTVDYILLTPDFWTVRQLLPTPPLAELQRRRSLPDAAMPSDHVPIAADLEWR
jgi:endonuclease/exonuclease/phosphatase family metal-dependent hydrolase